MQTEKIFKEIMSLVSDLWQQIEMGTHEGQAEAHETLRNTLRLRLQGLEKK